MSFRDRRSMVVEINLHDVVRAKIQPVTVPVKHVNFVRKPRATLPVKAGSSKDDLVVETEERP